MQEYENKQQILSLTQFSINKARHSLVKQAVGDSVSCHTM